MYTHHKLCYLYIRLCSIFSLPVSIKDCIAQESCDATCGAAARCFKPYDKDAISVQLLREAGSYIHAYMFIWLLTFTYMILCLWSGLIPFVRSNVPQLLLLPESDNQVKSDPSIHTSIHIYTHLYIYIHELTHGLI